MIPQHADHLQQIALSYKSINMKHLINIALLLLVTSCNKNENISPTFSPKNMVGQWGIISSSNKKSNDFFQEKDVNEGGYSSFN